MVVILEILKYTIPSLVAFIAVYYILRQYLSAQYQLQSLEVRSKYSKDAIPLKVQAYERLLLFCERISITNLLLRLKTNSMNATELKNAMVISIQKEYEHNMAQQLYASNKLWEIITLAKNDMIALVSNAYQGLDHNSTADELSNKLLQQLSTMPKSPLDLAIAGIKEEAKIILDV